MNHVTPMNDPLGEQRSESRSEPMKATANSKQFREE